MKHAILAIIVMLSLPVPLVAHGTNHTGAAATTEASTQLTEGEVRRVDKETRKITVRHGPIAHLEMPAMSMVFQVKNEAMLDELKAGDKIRFSVEKTAGAYTITHIERAR